MGSYAVTLDPEIVIVVEGATSHADAACRGLSASHAAGWSSHPSRVTVTVSDGDDARRFDVDVAWVPSFSARESAAAGSDEARCRLRAALAARGPR